MRALMARQIQRKLHLGDYPCDIRNRYSANDRITLTTDDVGLISTSDDIETAATLGSAQRLMRNSGQTRTLHPVDRFFETVRWADISDTPHSLQMIWASFPRVTALK
jgi:hypothetical protein